MYNVLYAYNSLVNRESKEPGIHMGVDLWQRLETVRQSAGWSGREFARRAGLRNDSHYGTTITRLKNGEGISGDTLTALAKAASEAGFRTEWVTMGEGKPKHVEERPQRSFTPTPTPASVLRVAESQRTGVIGEYPPNRIRATQLLVSRGHDESSINESLSLAALDAGLRTTEDPSVAWWIDRARDALLKPAKPVLTNALKKR